MGSRSSRSWRSKKRSHPAGTSTPVRAGPTSCRSRRRENPVIELHTDFRGQGLLVMDKDFTDITLTREQFTSYVDHEYHADLPAWRDAQPREHERERYARCMKALVWAGEDDGEPFHDRPIGQKLEIILQNNPFQCKSGDAMEVRVLFEGRPLANKHVTAQKLPVGGEPTGKP